MSVTLNRPVDSDLQRYYAEVRSRIVRSVAERPRAFVDIVRECEGTFPSIVRQCLSDFGPDIVATPSPAYSLPEGVAPPEHEPSGVSAIEGNPVLCSWYFTHKTCERIAKLRDWSSSRVAFLGTPRLFEWFRCRGLGKERLLLDLDTVVLEHLKESAGAGPDVLAEYDVADEVPEEFRGSYDCVFFDPPWYPDPYAVWLSRSLSLAPGGAAFFSLFPELTRPSAAEERGRIIETVAGVSRAVTLISSFIDYEVPSFEGEQLKAAGLGDLGPWKVADLLFAELREGAPPPCPAPARARAWEEVDIGTLRMFVAHDGAADDPSGRLLSTLEDGSTLLASPSRRNPGRQAANVLTSRGHGLFTPRPRKLIEVLRRLAEAQSLARPPGEEIEAVGADESSKALLHEMLGRL
jgi:hypothetical protein